MTPSGQVTERSRCDFVGLHNMAITGECKMSIPQFVRHSGKALVVGAALLAAVGIARPRPAHALGTGAAVGIGLGAFALGSAVGASANPYYGPSYYGPNYGPTPGYYYAPPGYYPYGY
jgi:hypothetical protein